MEVISSTCRLVWIAAASLLGPSAVSTTYLPTYLPSANSTCIQNAAVLLGGISLTYYLRRRASKQQLPLPPGPKGWPILGNAFDMPLENMAQGYAKWGKELSECT
jgi:hypothetical protein